jgi:soluble lytic murein transglycosylase
LYRLWKKISALAVLGLVLILLINSAWFLKLFYPFPHRELVLRYSGEYGVDPYLVLALIRTESRFYPLASSRVGARGLMQIMPETGNWIAGQMKMEGYSEEKLYQPVYNIPMGIWYLSYLDKTFSGNLILTLAAYNAGERTVKRWLAEKTWTGRQQDLEQIPYEETREYIDKVLFDYHIYNRTYAVPG